MHALIIEDEPIVALSIEEHLRGHGYTSFDLAATEAEAVTAANARCPDLITADVRLATGCGISAVEEICAEHHVPAVFITATTWEVHERAPDAPVLAKPFSPTALGNALSDLRA